MSRWLLSAQTDSPHRLAVFLDAELYLERVDAVAVITQLRARKVIPDVTCVFVSNQSKVARHEDYLCNIPYSEFIAQDIVAVAAAYAVAVYPPTNLHQRVSQIEGVLGAAERLKRLGAKVRYAEFRGGHDPGAWRADLPAALVWLFSADRQLI